MKKRIWTGIILMCLSMGAMAQIVHENIIELEGKTKRKGYLDNVVSDDAKKQFEMVFVTKNTNKKVEYEVLKFDYEFNLIDKSIESERKTKSKSKNKTYKGDYQEVIGVSASPNMTGKLVLRKTLYIKQWNWYRGEYQISKRLLDKEKPTELSGDGGDKKRKLFYTSHKDLSDKGDLLVLALINKGGSEMAKNGSREYQLMYIDKDMKTVKKTPITFQHPQSLLISKDVEESDDWILVFAPFGASSKISDPNPTNLTYVRIDQEGNVKERFNFNSKCNEWAIFDAYVVGNDVYFYGAGNIDKPTKNYAKYPFVMNSDFMPMPGEAQARINMLENLKFGFLQVVKISHGQAEFVSAVAMDEINSKGVKPAGQKKLREFDGKKFVLNDVSITSNGDVFISGQDFKLDKMGDVTGRVYKDLMLFHFDKTGTLKHYYGVENTAKPVGLVGGAGGAKSYPSKFVIYESPNGKNLYWNVFLVQDIDEDCSSETSFGITTTTTTTTCIYTPLYQGKYGKIDLVTGDISDFILFGGKGFYLNTEIYSNTSNYALPYFSINGGSQLVYVARKGGSLWLGKFDPLSDK